MKAQIIRPDAIAAIGLLLTAPALYFILISVLKDLFGPALFDAAAPAWKALGSKEATEWDLHFLIVFGPLIAFSMNLIAVPELPRNASGRERDTHPAFQKQVENWLVIGLSGSCLLIFFVYAIELYL